MKNKRLVITVGDDLHQRIMKQAKALGISAADFIRLSVNEKMIKDDKLRGD